MKRFTAVCLAMLLSLTWVSAWAESTGTQIDISNMRVSLIGSENKKVAKLRDMQYSILVGSAEGVPTLQTTFDYGDDQQMDNVLQLVGTRILMLLGGISPTLTIDLEDSLGGTGQALLAATAIGGGVKAFGNDPEGMIHTLMKSKKEGVYYRTIKLTRKQYRPVARRIYKMLKAADVLTKEELKSFRKNYVKGKKSIIIYLRYWEESQKLRITLKKGKKGIRIQGKVAMTTGPMTFIDAAANEMQVDLNDTDMDQAVQDELYSELGFLVIKITSFIKHSSLKKLQ
ncbi:MAG: hypothetical protein IJH38_03025 [Clostridia bacterium]|nr:hypothetical protein [Clostridia bacterium]